MSRSPLPSASCCSQLTDNGLGDSSGTARVLTGYQPSLFDDIRFERLIGRTVLGTELLQLFLQVAACALFASSSSGQENPVTLFPLTRGSPSLRVTFSNPVAPWQTVDTTRPVS